MDDELRRAIADAWAEDALDEHASIAAFSQFSLQLLALGAPPDLIADAHAAALDEIEHAKLSFRIASEYAGEALGPGPLEVEPIEAIDSIALVESTTREGIIGETAAARIAELEGAACEVPAIAAIRATIAVDEARHADLARRFVAWAIARFGEDARRAYLAGLAHDRPVSVVPEPPRGMTATFGCFSRAYREYIAERVRGEILAELA